MLLFAGGRLLVGGNDGVLRVFDPESGALVAEGPPGTGITRLAAASGAPLVASGHNDGSVRVDRFPDLADVLSGRAPGRQSAQEITGFMNNVGTGLQFAAAGAYVLKKAREQRVGTELPDHWFSEDVHP